MIDVTRDGNVFVTTPARVDASPLISGRRVDDASA
jgi:hypothetical protein